MEHGNRWRDAFRGRIRGWLVTTTMLLIAGVGSSPGRAAESKIKFNIPASNAAHALVEFAKQSKLQPLFLYTDKFAHLKTKAVVGEFEVTEALALLLEGTPLSFEFEDAVLIAIRGPAEWNVLPPSMASVD